MFDKLAVGIVSQSLSDPRQVAIFVGLTCNWDLVDEVMEAESYICPLGGGLTEANLRINLECLKMVQKNPWFFLNQAKQSSN